MPSGKGPKAGRSGVAAANRGAAAAAAAGASARAHKKTPAAAAISSDDTDEPQQTEDRQYKEWVPGMSQRNAINDMLGRLKTCDI